MTQGVVADPEQLRALAKKLASAGQQIDAMRSQVAKAVSASGWNDGERARFEQQVSADMRVLNAVAQRLQRDYPGQLNKKAAALDQYRR